MKKILFLNGNGLGDVILSTPIIKGAREIFPDSYFAFLVRPEWQSLVAGLPFINEVIAYQKGDSVWPVVKKIWKYDMALCLDFKYRSAVLPFLARIPIRAGMKHKRGLFLTHPVERDANEADIYEPYNFANILERAIGLKIPGDLTQLHVAPVQESIKAKVDSLFTCLGNKPMIAIAPYSSRVNKDWPIYKYSQLVSRLKSEFDCNVIMLSDPKDAGREKINGAIDWTGQTGLLEMSEIIRRSNLFIGPCSGPVHIAAAVKTPIVAMYCSTSPAQWAPKNNTAVIFHKVDCSPCDRKPCNCTVFPCLDSIGVEEVYEACKAKMRH
ncbi:MAG TPA: glycosyltransferase family 9 protein [Methylomusa anaerophila]|uniref:ADP-heptose--LPS heptosyltransferase 2 n=1 Tax=Methylomusa anaerophila TaxID=1930071 RepID=A0A348AKJ9_9FIRM|nr:glycosyltransferase family 9 protein [Methylomusa anaerophila]BBB91597.1 ADP-heptose--LPS heptosyltransferase 2 [Methylomusa anaerophila]HML89465.1 glycosyltransferase family 9 protein [Methylomusa anaerophila]